MSKNPGQRARTGAKPQTLVLWHNVSLQVKSAGGGRELNRECLGAVGGGGAGGGGGRNGNGTEFLQKRTKETERRKAHTFYRRKAQSGSGASGKGNRTVNHAKNQQGKIRQGIGTKTSNAQHRTSEHPAFETGSDGSGGADYQRYATEPGAGPEDSSTRTRTSGRRLQPTAQGRDGFGHAVDEFCWRSRQWRGWGREVAQRHRRRSPSSSVTQAKPSDRASGPVRFS